MRIGNRAIRGVILASILFAMPAAAQDSSTMQVGNASVTVGGGTAILTLPDVPSLMYRGANAGNLALLQSFTATKDFEDEIGWNVNGSIEVPTGASRSVSLKGYWARIDDSGSNNCSVNVAAQFCGVGPIVDTPGVIQAAVLNGAVPFTLTARADREVDLWGVSLESKWTQLPGVMGVTRAPQRSYIALGADIRGIDQDFREVYTDTLNPGISGSYVEDLDTRYYGVYAAWGRDYTLPFLSGVTRGLGLQSSFLLRGGIYYADTDYKGASTATAVPGGGSNASGALSLSRDDTAFIGGIVLETRKRIGPRVTLSLKSEYEYYSFVPEMAYNQRDSIAGGNAIAPNGQVGTRIGSDDAFSARTMLRLTIGLGSSELYQ